MQKYLVLFFLSILLSTILIFIFSKIFYKFNILDNPKKYNKNRKPVPYSMWVIFFLWFFILSYFFLEHDYKLYLLWFFGFIITIISFFDDLINLTPKLRLVIQIIIWFSIWLTVIKIWYLANIFWVSIDLERYYIYFFDYKFYLISTIFTTLWYVFIFNSLNWTDWLPWNTSFLSIMCFFIVFLLWIKLYLTDDEKFILNSHYIISLSLILIWVLIPFFYFDYKEKILMGDSWTMFLWFMLASFAIIYWWKIATVVIVFGIYIIDSIYVVFKRIINKKNPLIWDRTHLHHRLLNAWFTQKHVVFFIWISSFLFGFLSLFLDKIWKIILFIFIIIYFLFLNFLISKIISKNEIKS